MRPWTLTLVLLLVGPVVAGAQDIPRGTVSQAPSGTTKPIAGSPRGKQPILGEVEIGERAPDFVLDASNGTSEKLSSLRGQWLLLVFADRYRTVAPLDSIGERARKLQSRVVAVCREKQQTLMTYRDRDKISMLMLADPTGEVAATYGLYDWLASQTQPGFFVVDPEGIIRLAVIGKMFPPGDMMDVIRIATGDWEVPAGGP